MKNNRCSEASLSCTETLKYTKTVRTHAQTYICIWRSTSGALWASSHVRKHFLICKRAYMIYDVHTYSLRMSYKRRQPATMQCSCGRILHIHGTWCSHIQSENEIQEDAACSHAVQLWEDLYLDLVECRIQNGGIGRPFLINCGGMVCITVRFFLLCARVFVHMYSYITRTYMANLSKIMSSKMAHLFSEV